MRGITLSLTVTSLLIAFAAPAPAAHAESVPPAEPAPTATQAAEPAPTGRPSPTDLEAFDRAGADLPYELQAAVERDLGITPGQYLQQAEAAADASTKLPELIEAGISPDAIWLDGATLTVHAESPEQREAASSLGAVVVETPRPAPEVDLTQPVEAYEDLVGGTGLLPIASDGTAALCSVGFNGFDAAGARTMITAGHCFSGETAAGTARKYDQSAPNQSGTAGSTIGSISPNRFHFGDGDDVGYVGVTSSALTARPAVSTWNGSTVAVRGAITATNGAAICKSGRTTGWTCGHVLQTNASMSVEGGVVNSIVTDMCMYKGDSGGAALIGNFAAGINSSGGWSSAACTNDSIANVYPIQGHADSAAKTEQWEPAVRIETPVIGAVTVGAGAAIRGTLPHAAPGSKVSLYLDGSTAPAATVTVASDGTWSFTAPTVPTSGSHEFKVVAGYGKWNRSGAAAGVLVPKVDRIQGASRYETAIAISKKAYPSGSGVVYIATGENFPDALVAAPGAVREGGPLLLTPRAALPSRVVDEIERLGAQRAVIVGGTGAVSRTVEATLDRVVDRVERIAGSDRYATARQFVDRVFDGRIGTLYVATGQNFPDALSASAGAGANGNPVLTVPGGSARLDAASAAFIRAHAPSRIVIAGGTGAVSAGVQADLKRLVSDTARVSGGDRYSTSAAIAKATAGVDGSHVYLATGATFPDALAGAVLAGKGGNPLVLSTRDCIPAPVMDAIVGWKTAHVTLLGGTGTLTSRVAALKRC